MDIVQNTDPQVSADTGDDSTRYSQNNASKTTIAPYSLRGWRRPTVATPRTWDEITPTVRHLELSEVLDRVAGGLDPMAALLEHPTRLEGTSPLAPAVKVTAVRERRPPPRPVVVGGGRRPRPALPPGLAGPVQVALARSADRVPGPAALPGGSRYEPKYDGFRTAIVGGAEGVRLWSKSGSDLPPVFRRSPARLVMWCPTAACSMGRRLGRSTTLSRAQSRALAAVLTAVAVDHPWPDSIVATRFGDARDRVALTRVEPTVIVEVAADAAREYGVWRHGLRSIRLRADLTVSDLAILEAHGDTA